MTEQLRTPLSPMDAKEMGMADPYVAAFESRLARVEPYHDSGATRLSPSLTVIHPDRLLPAILWVPEDRKRAEILVGDGRELSAMFIHQEICRQNGVYLSFSETLPAWLLTIGDKRFISSEFLRHLGHKRNKLRSVLQRYRIEGIFAPSKDFDSKSSWDKGVSDSGDKWSITWLSPSSYAKTMDDLLRDDWTSHVAITYGLTNTELLRMRLTGELPEDKKAPVNPKIEDKDDVLTINFHPANDNPRFAQSTTEYEGIWREDGSQITSVIERLSRLRFSERFVDATVYQGMSQSHPLLLGFDYQPQIKKGVLVHELVHIIIEGNRPKLEFSQDDYVFDAHRLVDLVLYDAWVELYGEELARENVEYENQLMRENDQSPYERAWDWALGMTPEQRAEEFRKYF